MMSKNKIFKVFITFSTLDVTFLLYVLSSLPLDCHHQFFIYDNGYCFDFCCLLSPFLVLLIYYIIAVLLFFPLNKWFPFSLVFISFHFSPQYFPLDFFSAPIVAHYFFVFVLYCKTDCHLLASRLEKNE